MNNLRSINDTTLIFVGGIHGSGKGTVCNNIRSRIKIEHLSASDVLKWEEISSKTNKKVVDFEATQNRLINGLKNTLKPNHSYLLDGHFCLFNKEGLPEKISAKTFYSINPIAIAVVVSDPKEIYSRLLNRDKSQYQIETLMEMQEMEIQYSKELANEIGCPFFELKNEDDSIIIQFIQNL